MCFNEQFPKLFGGKKAISTIYVLDSDLAGNIAIGGGSKDADIINKADGIEKPLILFYSPDLLLVWAKRVFTGNAIRVAAIKFNLKLNNKILVVLDSNPITVMIVSATDGKALFVYSTDFPGVLPHSILYDENGNFYLMMD